MVGKVQSPFPLEDRTDAFLTWDPQQLQIFQNSQHAYQEDSV